MHIKQECYTSLDSKQIYADQTHTNKYAGGGDGVLEYVETPVIQVEK